MIENIFDIEPYSLKKVQKEKLLIDELNRLTSLHVRSCEGYKNILSSHNLLQKHHTNLSDFFPLPVRLFKEYDLKSSDNIIKTLTSSGTTSQKVSKIYLDKETAQLQSRALVKIMQSFLGKARLPMLIVESKNIIKNRNEFSARGAGSVGLSTLGKKHTYILNDDMSLDVDTLLDFLHRYKDEKILIFGFTFMLWQYFFKELQRRDIQIDLSNAIMFHSGGWKKLQSEAISNKAFKEAFKELTSLKEIHNFYGMVEQVGSIFVECEQGHLHTPNFADIIIRDLKTMEPLGFNKRGFIELLSLIPKSYPGHVLLSEDIGEILGEDSCKCGRMGKYFKVHGRVAKAEIRGCSDTHGI